MTTDFRFFLLFFGGFSRFIVCVLFFIVRFVFVFVIRDVFVFIRAVGVRVASSPKDVYGLNAVFDGKAGFVL